MANETKADEQKPEEPEVKLLDPAVAAERNRCRKVVQDTLREKRAVLRSGSISDIAGMLESEILHRIGVVPVPNKKG